MKEYVFYTLEGYTSSPNNKECENMQLLGFEHGLNEQSAKENLIKNNGWIEELDFDVSEIKFKQLLSKDNANDIKAVVEYLWKDEEKHFEESDDKSNHIFLVLQRLKELIK